MFTDPVGDMIARIRNAQMRKKSSVMIPHSKLKEKVLDALLREGYIRGFEVETPNSCIESDAFNEKFSTQKKIDKKHEYKKLHKTLKVQIKYYSGKPVIREIKRVSKPSIKIYSSIRNIESVGNGLGNAILTTSKGVLSDKEARANHVGGKILLTVR